MAKYRKKPVVIEAIQWDGSPAALAWAIEHGGDRGIQVPYPCPPGASLKIRTLEGVMTANPGDWIIQGVAGELYPCKAEIFAQTYEQAKEGDNETDTEA